MALLHVQKSELDLLPVQSHWSFPCNLKMAFSISFMIKDKPICGGSRLFRYSHPIAQCTLTPQCRQCGLNHVRQPILGSAFQISIQHFAQLHTDICIIVTSSSLLPAASPSAHVLQSSHESLSLLSGGKV